MVLNYDVNKNQVAVLIEKNKLEVKVGSYISDMAIAEAIPEGYSNDIFLHVERIVPYMTDQYSLKISLRLYNSAKEKSEYKEYGLYHGIIRDCKVSDYVNILRSLDISGTIEILNHINNAVHHFAPPHKGIVFELWGNELMEEIGNALLKPYEKI